MRSRGGVAGATGSGGGPKKSLQEFPGCASKSSLSGAEFEHTRPVEPAWPDQTERPPTTRKIAFTGGRTQHLARL